MDKLGQAVKNNALWIDRMCRLHQCSTRIRDGAWLSLDKTPPFHPNGVTLEANNIDSHYKLAEELIGANIPGGFAIKDSFAILDLSPLRMKLLFDAKWIYMDTTEPLEQDASNVEWEDVTTSASLSEWEQAWGSTSSDVNGVFLPSLYEDRDVRILGARLSGVYIAGCIANRDAGCVGISNVFLPQEMSTSYRISCVSRIRLTFPGLPLVGYESGTDLRDMQDIGFTAIGGLRVWYHGYESA